MASIVKSGNLDQDSDSPSPASPAPAKPSGPSKPPAKSSAAGAGGYFSIYKRSQGYWTRMGTAIAAAVIGGFIAYNLYTNLQVLLPLPQPGNPPAADYTVILQNAQTLHQHIALAVSIGFLLAYGLICWHLMNKPKNVEFLIATDVEMKKVNWTSRRELIGSTKVVVAFMFLTALFLFAVDMLFRFLMQLIHVLNWGSPF